MSNETNSSLNSTHIELPPLEWTMFQTFQSIILSLVVICSVCGNLLVLFAFIRYPKGLRQPTHYFLANLSLADLCVGLFSLPYLAVLGVTLRWYFGPQLCIAWTIMHFTFCASSILSTLSVCVERFIGVQSPLKHLQIMNRRVIFGICITAWLIALVLSAGPFLFWPAELAKRPLSCSVKFATGHTIVCSIGIFHLPAITMVIFYYLIYRSATSTQVKSLRRGEVETSNANDGEKEKLKKEQRRKEIRLAKKLAFPVGFLIISYLPMFTLFLILAFYPNFVSPKVFIWIALFRYFNSCVNPFIYAFAVPGYKRAFKNMFSCCMGEGGRKNSFKMSTISSRVKDASSSEVK